MHRSRLSHHRYYLSSLVALAAWGCAVPDEAGLAQASFAERDHAGGDRDGGDRHDGDRSYGDREGEHHGGRCGWTQWGQGASHAGQSCGEGQAPERALHHLEYDPFQADEIRVGFGNLFVHYQVPLNDAAGNFYMLQKGGTFNRCDLFPLSPRCGINYVTKQTWSETKYRPSAAGGYEPVWSFTSDWRPYPITLWEPMFQPALSGPFLYVPGAGGSVWQVLNVLDQPVTIQRINPFPTIDPNTFVSGGITVDRLGFLYWNVLQRDPATRGTHGFLVKAAPWGQTWVVDYATLIPDAPAADALCYATFEFPSGPDGETPPLPWPPSADALPPQSACGAQRPGLNTTPAIGRDGTIFTATLADGSNAYSYLVALRPDLSLRWATSLRGLVNDGCGVARPDSLDGDIPCSATFSAVGVDPFTNLPPALAVADISSSSPVALPDGGVLYGANDNYNFGRGHLVKLDARGRLAGTYPFGWDTTPAIYPHDGTYSIVLKDNYYTAGVFYLTQLSKDLEIEWRFQNTSTQACSRQPDGTLVCEDARDHGFEWCVNAPAVDAEGNVYANAEDGHVYQIGQGGELKTQTFLNQALGAAYTPISLDGRGRVFALNNGELTVLGE